MEAKKVNGKYEVRYEGKLHAILDKKPSAKQLADGKKAIEKRKKELGA